MILSALLRRSRPARGGTRRFAAVAGPLGIHAIEYARTRAGVEVVTGIRELTAAADLDELADGLADAVEAMGGRDGELSVGLSGFGTAHHILALPAAADDVLRPVVERELVRYYPDLDDPVIDFTAGAPPERGPEPKREVLVGAAPRDVGARLHAALARRGIRLRHLTILPRALQAVWDALAGDERPAILLVLLDTGPLIGCFHQGSLRLFIEPAPDVHGRPVQAPPALAEQIERAELFLRQQFPNLSRPRVLVAASEDELEPLTAALAAALEPEVEALTRTPAGSVVPLGVALDGEAAEAGAGATIELLPPLLRARSASERWTRRLAASSAAVLALAAVWWAGAGLAGVRAEAGAARAVESRVEAELGWLQGTRELLEARQGHEHRLLFLDQTTESRAAVRRVMAAVGAAAGPSVRLRSLSVEPVREGWWIVLNGEAVGAGSAAAVRAVDGLYRGIPDRLPATDLELGELTVAAEEGGASVALAFEMSFIVRWDTDLHR